MRSLKVFAALLILFFLNAAVCFAVGKETTDDYSSFYESSGADRLGDTLPDDIKDSLDSAGIDIADWQSLLSPSPKTRGTASLTSRMMTSAVLAMSRHTPVEPPKLK